jgi:uncharacterized membrane protein
MLEFFPLLSMLTILPVKATQYFFSFCLEIYCGCNLFQASVTTTICIYLVTTFFHSIGSFNVISKSSKVLGGGPEKEMIMLSCECKPPRAQR